MDEHAELTAQSNLIVEVFNSSNSGGYCSSAKPLPSVWGGSAVLAPTRVQRQAASPIGQDFFHDNHVNSMSAAERERFLDGCLLAQDHERLRMGRELHDSTGQLLLALRLEVARLRQVHGTPGEDGLLDEIDSTARQIDREIRSFAYAHYPMEMGQGSLVEALDGLARGFASRTGLQIRFSSLSGVIANTGEAALALLRIAQEALVNVHRHAGARSVRISLARKHDRVELVVRDDGVGVSANVARDKGQGVGLQGMRHRAEKLGGSFSLKRLKHGTKLTASVPYPQAA